MSEAIPVTLARQVRVRAGDRCEYCLLPQWTQEATFHIDHAIPRTNDGQTTLGNLALACVTCSLKKGARGHIRDQQTGERVRIFNPRRDNWSEHFSWTPTWRIRGLTKIGKATVSALAMNRIAILRIRRIWALTGRFP